ncbi:MAG TPA: hypothetical protein VM389_03030 [Phycisphaerae bacterium]|nr:hypothetical protein [Phycisphaerae bacterium]HUU59295.1 hypothetical protein [Phycisphaerae bacterium]
MFEPKGDPPACPGCGNDMARCGGPAPGPTARVCPKYQCAPCVRAGRGLHVVLQPNPNYVGPAE